MSDGTETPFVGGGEAPSREEIRNKVTKMKAKAATAPVPGKAKAKSKPMSEETKAKLRAASKRDKSNPCRCGCGELTGGTFRPGHDARYYGWLKKVASGEQEFKTLPNHLKKEFVDVKGVKAALAKSKH
jgi:hypothetical protein